MPDAPTPRNVTRTFIVSDRDTALAVGSGDLPVLGTPRLIAWCEELTCAALTDLPAGSTSVGTRVDVKHLAPSAVGERVEVSATVTARTEAAVEFAVAASSGELVVAEGVIERAIVDAKRFLARLADRRIEDV